LFAKEEKINISCTRINVFWSYTCTHTINQAKDQNSLQEMVKFKTGVFFGAMQRKKLIARI
jgi:hypothetical protein